MRLIDIARMANVSKATASRALADSPLVKDSTKQLVREIAEKYNYRPHTIAQAMARQHSGILGFCLLKKESPSFGHPFFGPVLDGALAQAREEGYHLILASDIGDEVFDEPFIQDCIEGVLLSSFDPLSAIQIFQKRKIPQVVINDVVDADHTTFVVDDNYAGALALVRHLIRDRNRSNIAILTDRLSHTSYLLRYLAYIEAHREAGISAYSNPLFANVDLYGGYSLTSDIYQQKYHFQEIPRFGTPIVVSGVEPEAAYQAVSAIIGTGLLPSAIFATSDSLAVGAIQALHQARLRIPENISVVGYDDLQIATTISPSLTTVRVNRKEIGRIAVRQLIQQIESPQMENTVITVPNELIIRQSS